MTRTRSERETAIILSDSGDLTVWTCSPVFAKRLRRRLGEPNRQVGETLFWDLSREGHSIPLPRRLGKPRKTPTGARFTKQTP